MITDFLYLEIGVVGQSLVPQVGPEEGGLCLPKVIVIFLVFEGIFIVHRFTCNKHNKGVSPVTGAAGDRRPETGPVPDWTGPIVKLNCSNSIPTYA